MNSKHGGVAFIRSGKLPVGKRHVARQADAIIAEMIDDLGGPGEVTATQKIIIAAIRQDLVFLGLVNDWLEQQPSIIDRAGEVLSPLGAFYLACQNAVTRNCRELGLKRVAPIQSLEKYLENKAKEARITDVKGKRKTPGKRPVCAHTEGEE